MRSRKNVASESPIASQFWKKALWVKNRDFGKEKIPKTSGFQDSLVEISGIEPLTS